MDTRVLIKDKVVGVLKGIDYNDPLVIYRGNKIKRLAKLVNEFEPKKPISYILDTYYSLYLPFPILKPIEEIPFEKKAQYMFIKTLLSSSFIYEIKSKTLLDSFMSSLATVRIISEIEEQEISFDKGELSEDELRNMVEKAMNNVARDIENVRKLRRIIESDEPGTVSMVQLEEYGPELLKLARDLDVKKILDLISSIKPWEIRVSEKRYRFKHGEIHGYELGNELERIVPSNLALPSELFYLRFLEKKLLLYQKMISESKGALYVLVDKSGSMDGLKMTWAKAVALSLYMKALKEKRKFCFRFFDSIPYELRIIGKQPKVTDVSLFINYIAKMKGSGGTDISRAILTACNDIRMGKVREVSDIVLITDGVDKINENLIKTHLKKSNARLITVMIMGDNKSLKNASFKYFAVASLSSKNILKIIEID
ncbi:MAG: hypothetical protein QXO78_03400 [Desulfurococcaceae archaeon]